MRKRVLLGQRVVPDAKRIGCCASGCRGLRLLLLVLQSDLRLRMVLARPFLLFMAQIACIILPRNYVPCALVLGCVSWWDLWW